MRDAVPERTIERARAGDPQAWAAIYDTLAPQLLGYLRARRAADPEDLLGEVFAQVARDIGRFRGDGRDLRAWAFAIARNRLIDQARARSRHPVQSAPDDELEALGPEGNVESEAVERVAASDVLALLHRLTPDQRDVLLLRIVADLSIEETARAMRRRKGAVKGLQHRAIGALRRLLAERDENQKKDEREP